jgi:glutamyl-tRNA synthetase
MQTRKPINCHRCGNRCGDKQELGNLTDLWEEGEIEQAAPLIESLKSRNICICEFGGTDLVRDSEIIPLNPTKKGEIWWATDPVLRRRIAVAYATRPNSSHRHYGDSDYFEGRMVTHWIKKKKVGPGATRTLLHRLRTFGDNFLENDPSTRRVRVGLQIIPSGGVGLKWSRTALFSWLFARNRGGVLVLRIADLEVERKRPELEEGTLKDLRWLGLDWDVGPFYQSERLDSYVAAAEKLLATGAAYRCYCSPEDKPKPRPVRRCGCRQGKPSRTALNSAVRFRVPLEGTTRFEDEILGAREVNNDEIEDFILLSSSRKKTAQYDLPTYEFAAVLDDIDLKLTHVIRGATYISSTPKQVLLYRTLGATPPIFAHVPAILGPDRGVGSYRDEGFLPEAFRNYLALLGLSSGDDTEFLRTSNLIERFSFAAVSRTDGDFDRAKLEEFNQHYLQKLPIAALLPIVQSELERTGLWRPEWADKDKDWFVHTMELLRPKTRLLPDFSHSMRSFFASDFSNNSTVREKPSESASPTFWAYVVPLLMNVGGALLMSTISTNSGPDRLLSYRLMKRL